MSIKRGSHKPTTNPQHQEKGYNEGRCIVEEIKNMEPLEWVTTASKVVPQISERWKKAPREIELDKRGRIGKGALGEVWVSHLSLYSSYSGRRHPIPSYDENELGATITYYHPYQ